MKKKILISAALCNGLEVYDFFMWGLLAPHIAHLFLPPNTDPLITMMVGFLAFSLSYITKPLGAFVWGYIGDVYGRKTSLFWTILGMSAATTVIGLVPIYENIGIWSPILVTSLRMLQGFCAGGEGYGSMVYTLEHVKGDRPGWWGSLLYFAHNLGFMAALLTTFILTSFVDIVETGAWRLCFLAGASLGYVGFYIRSSLKESPFFEAQKRHHIPFFTLLKKNPQNFINLFLLVSVLGAASITMSVFTNGFLTEFMGYSISHAKAFLIGTSLVCLVTIPVGGYLCDKVGAERIINTCTFLIMVFAFPFHILLSQGEGVYVMLALALYAIPVCMITGALPHYMATSFSKAERFTGTALANTLSEALVVAHQPAIAVYIILKTGSYWVSGVYVFILCVAFFFYRFLVAGRKIKVYAYNE